MLRTILVDDKTDERLALLHMVDWRSMGYEIVGEAVDGLDAWEMLGTLKVDVVLTDIIMPRMDGLALIERAREVFPHIRFVVMSCHDQFRYAQAAVKYHVRDYLLKPLIVSELHAVLRALAAEIAGEVSEQSDQDVAFFEQYIESIQHAVIADLLKTPPGSEEMARERLNRCGLMALKPPFGVFVGKITPEEKADAVIAQMASWFHADTFVAAPDGRGALVALAHCASDPLSIAQRVCREVRESTESVLTLGVSVADTLLGLHNAGEQARVALEASFYLGEGQALDGMEIGYMPEELRGGVCNDPVEIGQQVQHALRIPDADAAKKEIGELLLRAPHAPQRVRAFAICMVNACQMMLFTLQQSFDAAGINEITVYEQILSVPRRSDVLKLAEDVLMRTYTFLYTTQRNRAHHLAEQMIKVMKARYAAKLTQEDVAREVHLHPVYAATIFKQATGQTMLKYLTNLRIDKAMELMKSQQCQVYEVCEKVGYWNRSHFTATFKEHTGMTPREFAALCEKANA